MTSLIQSLTNLFATSAVQFHPYYLFCTMNAVHNINKDYVCNNFGGFLNNQCNDYFSKNPISKTDKSLCYQYITYKDNQNVDIMINRWDTLLIILSNMIDITIVFQKYQKDSMFSTII